MKRLFDLVMALVCGILLLVPMLIIALAIRLTSPGPVLYWSKRVGRNNRRFRMPKFRTMLARTPQKATHLLDDPSRWVTSVGRLLRKLSLDELPQIWNILKGQMSFVGPRPALYNQFDLIEARDQAGVSQLMPGLTGWAQVNGRDELSIPDKVRYDTHYLNHQSLGLDLKIIWLTFYKVLQKEGVKH